jgi:hypothetical protein
VSRSARSCSGFLRSLVTPSHTRASTLAAAKYLAFEQASTPFL